MRRLLFIGSVTALLSGCSAHERVAAIDPSDDAACQYFGAQPGTQPYFQCRMPLSEGRSVASVAQPDDCGKLQQACLDEDWLGLGFQGRGNCQHFRDACGSNWILHR